MLGPQRPLPTRGGQIVVTDVASSLVRGGVRAQGAGALLFTVLGEFVLPSLRPVWSSELLTALVDFGIEGNAARKALRRAADAGFLEPTREGRRTKWTLSTAGYQYMTSGAERVYGWPSRNLTWDGRWFVLCVSVPESQRKLRHHLQTRLSWAGLGSPLPSQWITPHAERSAEVAVLLSELSLEDQAYSFVGTFGAVGSAQEMVRAAWDLDSLSAEYEEFVRTFAAAEPHSDRERMIWRVQLVQAWRRFPYRDPDLPGEFLPQSWPGDHAARLFQDRHQAWAEGSARYWQSLADDN